jgi:predicted Zn-dependent protease
MHQRTAAAIAQLREVLRLKPLDAEAFALLGELYERANNADEAIRFFTLWAEQPTPLDTIFYESVIGGELSVAAANARLGQVLIQANRASEAVVALRRALVAEPTNPAYVLLLEQVLESGTAEDSAQVIGELENVVRRNPANVQAVRLLARRQARAGRTEEAVNALRQALKSNAADAISKEDRRQLQIAIGETYARALRLDEAVVAYEAALLLNGINDDPLTSDEDKGFAGAVLESMLELRRQQGQWAAADNLINRMRVLLGDADPSVDLQIIVTMRDQGKRAETLKAARNAKARFPEQPVFLRLEASALADLGQVEEAVRLLQDRRRDPDPFGTQLYVANIYTQAGRAREAIAAAETALRIAGAGERETQALLLLASARERGGDAKGAEEALRRVLTREPNNATALNNLGYFLVERGVRLDEALALIERAVRLDPSNGSFLDSFGWALFKLGRFAESERQLAEAARRNPASATIQEHLGDVYQRLGKTNDARSAWQRALALTSRAEEGTRLKSKLNGNTQ